MKFSFVIYILLVQTLFCQTQDSLFVKYIKPGPIYRYYVYAEALHFISKAPVINIEILSNRSKLTANYFKVFFGTQKIVDYINYYPDLKGKYNIIAGLFYVLTKNRRQINYEFSAGIGGNYGDPTARIHASSGLERSKLALSMGALVGLRYTFKKVPIHVRLWAGLSYDPTTKKFYPIPGLSLGYAFKKLS